MKKETKEVLKYIKSCCINNNNWWTVCILIIIFSTTVQVGIIYTLDIPLYTPIWKYEYEYALSSCITELMSAIPECIWGFISIRNALKYDF